MAEERRIEAEDRMLQKRFLDLANMAYEKNQYTFTGFLNSMEQALLYQMTGEPFSVPFTLYGGMKNCERKMVRFGSAELFGYEEEYPIICICVEPLLKKFSDDFTHRDFLGAVMNLGIERSEIGDIITGDKEGYLFCREKMAAYIMDNLTKVKHTHVRCAIKEHPGEEISIATEIITQQVSSQRADGIIAKIFQLSRSDALKLFTTQRIFVDGRVTENNSYSLKEGEIVSVRGYGKFRYLGARYITKKGKLSIEVEKYI